MLTTADFWYHNYNAYYYHIMLSKICIKLKLCAYQYTDIPYFYYYIYIFCFLGMLADNDTILSVIKPVIEVTMKGKQSMTPPRHTTFARTTTHDTTTVFL